MHIYKGMEWFGNYHTDGRIHVQSICMRLSHKQLDLRNGNFNFYKSSMPAMLMNHLWISFEHSIT